MKKVSLLILLMIVIVSCEEKSKLNYSIVSGKIVNNFQKEIVIESQDLSQKKVIKVESDGSFKDTLSFEDGVYFINFIKRTPIYVEGGNEIFIDLDNSNYSNTLNFSGKGSEASMYIHLKEIKLNEILPAKNKLFELDEKAFESKLEEIKNIILVVLNSSEGISNTFKEKENRNLDYFNLIQIDRYKIYHGFLTKNNEYKMSNRLLEKLEDLDVDIEEDFFFSEDYRKLVDLFYRKKVVEFSFENSLTYEDAYFKVAQGISNIHIRNWLLFDFVNKSFDSSLDKKWLYDSFMKISTNKSNNEIITELHGQYENISKGKKSPGFENFKDVNGELFSLNDFTGKPILINVWSTSFSSCLEEMELLKDQSKYSIEIVNISLDTQSNIEKWKESIITNNFVGKHLIANKSWLSNFVEEYKIQTLPRFILLDRDGIIINSNAPKPSDKGLTALIKK